MIRPGSAESRIYDLVLYDNMGPPNFTQFGAVAALRQGEDFIAAQKERFIRNEALVAERFDKIGGITHMRPRSSFYSFFKSAQEPSCMDFARRLVDEYALALAPGCAFGRNFHGYMRMCFAVSEPKLMDALDRLEKALA